MLITPCEHWTASEDGPVTACSDSADVRVTSPEYGLREYLCRRHVIAVFSEWPREANLQMVPTSDLDPFVEQLLRRAVITLRSVSGMLGTYSERRRWWAVISASGIELTERVEAEAIIEMESYRSTSGSSRII